MGHCCRAASGKRRSAKPLRLAWWASAGLAPLCLLLGSNVWAEFRGRQYTVDRPQLAIDLFYRSESETRTGPYITEANHTQAIGELLSFKTAGWLYHPALATYTLSLEPEWQQTTEKPDLGRETNNKTFLLGYGFETTVLPYRPYTVKLFASKQHSTLTSSLTSQSDTEGTGYGATLMLKYKVLPTTLSYNHSATTQTGFYDSQETRDGVTLVMRHERKNNDTHLNGAFTLLDRTTSSSVSQTKNLSGDVQNVYRIRPGDRLSLNSSLAYRWSESGGGYSASGLSLSENLNWRHRKKLSSSYQFNYSQDTVQGISVDQMSVGAGLSHTLYENLTSGVGVSASRSSSGTRSYGGGVNFNYQRRIPWGMIHANMGHDYRVTNRSIGGVNLPAIESHTLTTGGVALLGNKNVDMASLVVTSSDLSIVYIKDFDYTLEAIGTSVRISRTSFGSIAEGQSVVVNYMYLSNPAFDDALYSQNFSLGFDLWSALRIDYRYTHGRQDFLGGIRPDVLTDDTSQSLEADLTWRWSSTRMYYEDSDTTSGTSRKRWQVQENLQFRPSYITSFGASAYYGQTTLKDSGAQDKFHGFTANAQRLISGTSKVRLEALYNVSEGATISTLDKGAAVTWEWSYGIWRADATYRFLDQEDLLSGQTRKRNSALVTLRRTLY